MKISKLILLGAFVLAATATADAATAPPKLSGASSKVARPVTLTAKDKKKASHKAHKQKTAQAAKVKKAKKAKKG
jgi:hypothetical protein